MQKKIYCGSGKKRKENWLSITINPDKFKDHIQEYNGNKFVKLNINILEQPDKFGKDVSVSVDTYQPEKKEEANDLPF
jgi:predicted Mrr-cat superfamily restriction endonuclease